MRNTPFWEQFLCYIRTYWLVGWLVVGGDLVVLVVYALLPRVPPHIYAICVLIGWLVVVVTWSFLMGGKTGRHGTPVIEAVLVQASHRIGIRPRWALLGNVGFGHFWDLENSRMG